MPASRAAASVAVPLSNEPPPCPTAEATKELAEVGRELLAELKEWRAAFTPAAATIEGFGGRLDALCRWLKKWGPWLLGSAPGVLVAIGAISPNAAQMLKNLLAAFGG